MNSKNLQRTLAIIKPDAVAKKYSGKIIDFIESSGLNIVGIKTLRLSPEKASILYAIHKGKPFYDDLVSFISSGKIIVLALEGVDAINLWRKIMGNTDPIKAKFGTIRKLYGTAVNRNACHGSDSIQTAETELNLFFKPKELVS